MNKLRTQSNGKQLGSSTSELKTALADPLIRYAVEQLGARVKIEVRPGSTVLDGNETEESQATFKKMDACAGLGSVGTAACATFSKHEGCST